MKKSLLLIAIFQLLSFSLLSVPQENFLKKLTGPLKDVIKIYRQHSRLTPENMADHLDAKRKAMNRSPAAAGAAGPDRDSAAARKKDRSNIFLDALILPEVQKRWRNPGYDVIKCNIELSADPAVLDKYNLKVRSVSDLGDRKVVNVEVAGTEIEKLARIPDVSRIDPVLKRKKSNDRGSRATAASRIRLGSSGIYTKGYTGKGVIVGIIDTGIDWAHEDFIDPRTGSSRILYLWDTEVDTPGRNPADILGGALSGLGYGTVWTRADIDAGTCTSIDIDGHGSHVCGSAAGNGAATGRYTGMAPMADIIVVKGLDNNGILFVYELASRLGRPCVVNMSYTPMFTLHYMAYWPEEFPADGTSLAALQIRGWNNTYGAGHIPVKAAGNDGHWNSYTDLTGGDHPYMSGGYHGGASLSSVTTYNLEVPDYAALWNEWWGIPPTFWDYPFITLGFWYESPIQVTLISPNGHTVGPMVHGSTGVASTTGDGWCWYDFTYPEAANRCFPGVIDLEWDTNPATEPVAGQWQVRVEPVGSGSGRFDMWTADFNFLVGWVYPLDFQPIARFLDSGTHSNYIIDEGASPYEICVGSWVTRDSWTDIDGQTRTYDRQPWLNDIDEYSSPGPSRDRRVKPDVSAPGVIIASAAGQHAGWTDTYLVDSGHGVGGGTSMAAAYVSGGIALILQKHPRLDVDAVRGTISRWARQDQYTAERGRDGFGFGKFWVLPLNDPPVAVISSDKEEVFLDEKNRRIVFDGSASHDPEKFPLEYSFEVESEAGKFAAAASAAALDYSFVVDGSSAVLDPDPDVEARYRVSLVVNDTIVDSDKVYSAYVVTRFYPVYPPAGFTLERLENNYIFFKEYINRLTWQVNPENQTEIKFYRLYRKDKGEADSTYQLIATLESGVYEYVERGLDQSGLYTYKMTAVNYRGKESDPVTVSN